MTRFVTVATLAAALFVLSACSVHSRTPYEPERVTADPQIERLLVRFERAINGKDPNAVCWLYADPHPLCDGIWRGRLRTWRVPVELSLHTITGGCAGDARVSFRETTRFRQQLRTLTVVSLSERSYDPAVIDIAVGNRLSSLVLPRYGDCANFDDGSAGAPNLDQAGSGGQGNGW